MCGRKNRASKDAEPTEPRESTESQEENVSDGVSDCEKSVCCCNAKTPYLWFPSSDKEPTPEYVRKLETEFACMQQSVLGMSTQFARMQFRLRQILQACPIERAELLLDLERIAFDNPIMQEDCDELPKIMGDIMAFGEVRSKQTYILDALRSRMVDLEQAANALENPPMKIAAGEVQGTDEDFDSSEGSTICCFGGARVSGYDHEKEEVNQN